MSKIFLSCKVGKVDVEKFVGQEGWMKTALGLIRLRTIWPLFFTRPLFVNISLNLWEMKSVRMTLIVSINPISGVRELSAL